MRERERHRHTRLRSLARAAVFVLLLAGAGTARAGPPGSEDDNGDVVEVTVRGSSAGSFATRRSTDTTPREPLDVASVISDVPSVHVRRLGADGSFATMSVRGAASTQVAVVLAGVPLTSAADPSADIASLPLWPGAGARVYRGFAPASLGSGGYLGGVLVLDPPSPESGSRTEWWTAAGSFGSLKLRIGDARRIGGVTVGTALFASRSDGDFSFETAPPGGGAPHERERTNAGYAAVGAVERISVERSWGSVGATLYGDARRTGLPGVAQFPTTVASLASSRLVAGVDGLLRTGTRGAWHAAAWGRRETSRLDDPLGELGPSLRAARTHDAIEAAGGSAGWRGRPVEAVTLDLFLDGRGERFVPGGANGVLAHRLAGGAGCDAAWRAGRRVTFAGAARVDARRDDAQGMTAAGRRAPGESDAVAPSGHAGVSIVLAPPLAVSAHAGALERPPSFVELYGDRGALLGDPTLRPERALAVDLGLEGAAGDAGARVEYELVGFASSVRDLIAFVPLGRSTFVARNVERAAVLGAEISVALTARRLRTSVSYTLLHTDNRSDDPLERGRPLPGRPLHDLAYDAGYRFGPVGVRYELDAVAGSTVDVGGRIELPARVLHGAGASLDVPGAPGLRAGVQVDNLFDVRTLYVQSPLLGRAVPVPLGDFLGFPLPGRTVWVTLRYRIETDRTATTSPTP